ncbi:DUF362 domain-containing protein [Halarsenatibacter silvermanii]|uniref:Uncharacterized conserved protein, DUF362 family n=1 Tax=Halarsenatibacter silvermanii TaxID=321763 RepID=A0A1G9LZD2_9FIRM|nr:DUF362 domain-containing protein [Halarsenatibacter silvermanii]SDL67254.1 Uncharacterized conserved protein, DUF362 family [Halarsenatibacter silvermanii]
MSEGKKASSDNFDNPGRQHTVALTEVERIDNSEDLRKAAVRLLKPFGGSEEIFGKADTILLKPNLVAPRDYTSGAVTNPHLAAALAEIIEFLPGEKKIYLGDGASVGQSTEKALITGGYEEVFAGRNVEILDIKEEEFEEYSLPGGRSFTALYLPAILREIDLIVNLPVFKTHDVFPATLGLKNLKGLIREQEKKLFHQCGLAEAIIDLNLCLAGRDLDIFTIYDGTVAMEGAGPIQGEAVNFKKLAAADNILLGDEIAAECMGIAPEEVKYIEEARRRMDLPSLSDPGLTPSSVTSGLEPAEIRRDFEVIDLDESFYGSYDIDLNQEGGCSGCRHLLDCMLKDWSAEELSELAGKTICIGDDNDPPAAEKEIIKIGVCTAELDGQGLYIPGCPPHPENLKEKILGDKNDHK